ncbi:dihydrolipoamide acetyltransferase family protein [Demequina muriae]|uniref:Dihydrolipoamide acetyltransferase component of pyruvate dehydrogenase complex n=1 Tax=Demequina muriae TaxID=3051664 RepID=A0ABT8GGM8_9MICO|nr:dihydrolipoamide acetyltransferase family protein [Demequina sp. EGI L300058]MDN4480424.1 dihydrolipoamide acetyltransferase family protein [Demequina sp. EGI L300058]
MPTFQQFAMPDAGEGLTEADIVTWLVAPGDVVEVNQPIVEIETAKSLVELPCPYDGVVSRLLVQEGETVEVGVAILEVDVDPDGEAPAVAPSAGESASESPSAEPVQSARSAREDLSADAAPSAPRSQAAEASTSPQPADAGESSSEESGAVLVGYGVKAGSAHRRPRKDESVEPVGGAQDLGEYPVLAKPPVRKLARDLGVDLTTITPSGPGGMVTREDVEQQVKATSAQTLATYPGDEQQWLAAGTTQSDGRATRVPVKSVRKRTAEAMVQSAFTAPHVTEFHTVDVTETMNLVNRLKQDKDFADVRVTPLLIVAKALLLAVRRHPEVNASWDDAAQEIVYKHYVNLGIAASTPRGLVVPNIKDAHRLPLHELALELQHLTAEARAGKLSPSSMSDGTITITNVGALGIDTGTPILNPGEAAILAFGAIRQQPWVHEGEIQVRWITQLALSFDHRLVDGGLGARLLSDVGRVMNDPAQGLVWG